ncbi:hypothetical protein [Roseovarius spongiae]|uniref:hypothetical protein n=1 Tax=Roseovarius spongiae TaxID=2320272 RepID=UPI00140C285E|nr:hypothetical protein [Roseovarius spongiae]
MKIPMSVFIFAIAMAPTLASPQSPSITLDNGFDICPDRPSQPEWIDRLPSRDAFQGAVIQMIYRAQSYKNVIEAGECSCAIRFPSWKRSVQQFNDNYLGADRNGLRDARNEYRAQANETREAAKALCEDAGNW